MTPFKLAVLNLSRRKVPTTIAVIAIALAVACSGILLRMNLLAQSRFSDLGRGGDAIVGPKSGGIEILLGALQAEGSYPGLVPYNLFETLRSEQTVRFEDGEQSKPSFVRSVIPILQFAKYKDIKIIATDESFINRPRDVDSLHFAEGSWAKNPAEVVIGANVASKQGLKIGDKVGAQVWMGDKVFAPKKIELQVVGIFSSTNSAWDKLMYTSLSTSTQALQGLDLRSVSIWGPKVLNYFLVYLEPNGFEGLSTLINNRTVAQAIDIQTETARLKDLVGIGQDLGLFVTLLVLVLGGLSVASMLITRFDAMSLQLAVLRAIGYKKSEIGKWLLWEGFILGAFACAIGMIFDGLGFPFIHGALGTAAPGIADLESSILLSFPVWITAIAATTLSVVVPLYRVYHQDVHFSLRG